MWGFLELFFISLFFFFSCLVDDQVRKHIAMRIGPTVAMVTGVE